MSSITFHVNDDPNETLTLPVQRNRFADFADQTSGTIGGITVTKDETANYLRYSFSSGSIMPLNDFLEAVIETFPGLYGVWDFDITDNEDFEVGTTTKLSGNISNVYYQISRENLPGHSGNYLLNIKTQSNYVGTTSDYGYYCSCLIAFMNSNSSDARLGFFTYRSDTVLYVTTANILIDKNFTLSASGLTMDDDPGDKGFKPTAELMSKNKPGVGGRPSTGAPHKTPAYETDTVSQPGAPDETHASAVGSGFINCYSIDTGNLAKVGQCLYGSNMLGFLQSLAINPLDFIISLMVFPCKPNLGSNENIKLGGWLAAAAGGGALGFDATGNRLANQFKVFDFGTVQINENWGNFLDYSQTTLELYLPFIGSVNLDVSECMGGTVNVQYTVDFFTGQCVANILCERQISFGGGKSIPSRAQHSYQGNCAIQIPLSAVNYGSMVGSLISACAQGITNPVGGFVGIASDAVGGGFRPNVSSKGNIVANSGFCSVLHPYIRITRPITAEPVSYQEVVGYPSYINTTLGECNDLCVCDDIDLKGVVGATDDELDRIRALCRDGVYV